ncbi:hypothetical protein [Acinetobacter sp. CAAS 2-6]|uniref:hypothetical protein n=1 Tax=Acinetobacter sp. CAAS 2-6 TaxID=3016358 RepID=UPI002DD61CA2|nr:hypothetical protein [Acinetobacter sp. CAAS 2-6]
MTALTVGYMSSMRSMQSSSITAHAQTQAQIKAMVGYQALTKFLQNKVSADFDQIATGTVTYGNNEITYTKVDSTCPASSIPGATNYCFDILGKSGEASAIIRAIYTFRNQLSSGLQTGSVFAGGLKVNSNTGNNQNLFGSSVSLEVGGGVVNSNNNHTYTTAELQAMGVTVTPYVPRSFVTANDLKDYSNYVCTVVSSIAQCVRKNLGGATLDETNSITLPAGITYSEKNGVHTWSVEASKNLPAGVLWFDGNVNVTLDQNKPLVNSIIATGTISSDIPTNVNSTSTFEAYAPYHYILNASSSNMENRLNTVCPTTNYPLQYCSSSGALKSTSDMQLLQATVANILYLGTSFALDSGKSQQDITVNYYGNLIASSGAGGTGKSSGKFTGTGVINVSGNLMVTGDADMSELTGSIAVKLSNAQQQGNYIPTYIKVLKNGPIRYM